jgi:hypothetical protein
VKFDKAVISTAIHEFSMGSQEYERACFLSYLLQWQEVNLACIEHRTFIRREGFGQMSSLNSELRDWTQRVRWAAETIGYTFKRRKLTVLSEARS